MSTCLDTVIVENKVTETLENNLNNNYGVVLRCSENILKCDKVLKRKLKKYKLRKDGKEDQEIIDVSQTFITSLTIKSPNSQVNSVSLVNTEESDKELFKNIRSIKMGRRKKDVLKRDLVAGNGINPIKSTDSSVSCIDKQDKRQTDAFKLLMDSRSKVIGSNSPGKDRTLDVLPQVQDIIEKKEIKAKRILSLQKMAQAKGALQKQEMEELREKCVKLKMEKRAERLKNMIVKNDSNTNREVKNKLNTDATEEKLYQADIRREEDILSNKSNSVSEVKSPSFPEITVPTRTFNKTESIDEEEFLKKLSPSMRKKENMLCYYNIVTKDTESCSDNSQNGNVNSNSQAIIKVKFTPKNKKKKKLGLISNPLVENKPDSKSTQNDDITQKVSCINKEVENYASTNERKNRKRKKLIKETDNNHNSSEHDNSIAVIAHTETRPKRNTRKPIKYADDVSSISSDEELHIFTPKKKKSSESISDLTLDKRNGDKKIEKLSQIPEKKSKHLKKTNTKVNVPSPMVQDKKPSKLAPIFTVKPQLTAVELEAKQKFLHSGIPNHLKKSANRQCNLTSACDNFHSVVHIQQIVPKHVETTKCLFSSFPFLDCEQELDVNNIPPDLFKNLLMLKNVEINVNLPVKNDIKTLLHTIKQKYLKFPVYRTYHYLKAKSRGEFADSNYSYLDDSIEIVNGITNISNDNPDKLKWTDKYKATSTKQLIGNFESIKEIRKWLISWTESEIAAKYDSDSSDFYHSDTDSGDVIRMRNNLLILTGKTGSGKTSCVYAVASELLIKVIEVNASSKRTGKIMLQDLQEATQSHKVDRQRDCIDSSQKSLDKDSSYLPKLKKRGRPKKTIENLSQKSTSFTKKDANSEPFSSQESLRTGMSLILIDDAHIVFDQDDGFCSAITQLIHSSKRPVILVTESLQCPHLQKFLKYGQIINMQPLLPRMLGTWLDIMCLADNGTCYPGLGAKLLDFFKGDIRKSINCLQYYMTSQKYIYEKECASQGSDLYDKQDVNDETSSMSWAVNEDLEEKASYSNAVCSSNDIYQYFMDKQLSLYYQSPDLLFNVWWSVPHLLNLNSYDVNVLEQSDTYKEKKQNNVLDLEAIATVIDTLSVLDMLEHNQAETQTNITSKPWFSPESASLTENENFQYYDRNNELTNNISQRLMTSSIEYAQTILKCEHKTDVQFPSLILQREKDKIVSRHMNLAGYLNPAAVLDRKAVSLDYWSCCRTICRTERTKTDLNSKRNNRFCHYLKSLNVLCKNDYFDKLGDSLYSKDSIS